jgi:hypothetical protein
MELSIFHIVPQPGGRQKIVFVMESLTAYTIQFESFCQKLEDCLVAFQMTADSEKNHKRQQG